MEVRSTVIDWISKALEVTDKSGAKHSVPLDTRIRVTMVGYPDRETKTLLARDLGPYMSRGYVIEQIDIADSKVSEQEKARAARDELARQLRNERGTDEQ